MIYLIRLIKIITMILSLLAIVTILPTVIVYIITGKNVIDLEINFNNYLKKTYMKNDTK